MLRRSSIDPVLLSRRLVPVYVVLILSFCGGAIAARWATPPPTAEPVLSSSVGGPLAQTRPPSGARTKAWPEMVCLMDGTSRYGSPACVTALP